MHRSHSPRAGVTLIEMLVVVTIIGLMVGITVPAVTSGLDSLRLKQASNDLTSLLNDALTRAARSEQAVEITVSAADRSISAESTVPGFLRRVTLPQGVNIVRVLPEDPQIEAGQARRFFVYPGGVPPSIGVEFVNGRGVHQIIRVDPMTGVPRTEAPEEK